MPAVSPFGGHPLADTLPAGLSHRPSILSGNSRMSEHRRHTSLAWIVPILLVLPSAWLGSFGVALAMWSGGRLSNEARDVICGPIVQCARSPHCPSAILDGIYWFGTLGGYGMSDIELYFLLCETQTGLPLEQESAASLVE